MTASQLKTKCSRIFQLDVKLKNLMSLNMYPQLLSLKLILQIMHMILISSFSKTHKLYLQLMINLYFSFIEKSIEGTGKTQTQILQFQNMIDDILQSVNQKFQNYHISKEERGPVFAKRKIPQSHFQAQNIWILKATGFNRGRGIHVFNKLEDLKKLIKEYTDGLNYENQYNSQQQTNKLINKQINEAKEQKTHAPNNPLQDLSQGLRSTSFVIQKYVERPLLLRKRKFDIRVWVLVNQDAKCYFFKEGYIRTSCEEFTLSQDSITKPSIHLTNNAVQKYAENYGKFEDGNQLSFKDLQDILSEEDSQANPNYVKELMIPQMKEIIINNLDSVKKKLKIVTNQRGQGSCFELFGYDFIIDADYGLWLIEVNTNPCLEESSQLLCKYIPRMANDMLKLTVDSVFQQKKGQSPYDPSQINQFSIDNYTNEENMWEYIFQLEPFIIGGDSKVSKDAADKLSKIKVQ